MFSAVSFLKYALSPVAVFLITAQCAFAQLPFSFQRNFIREESLCIPVAELDDHEADDILRDITRFGEAPISSADENVFRVIDYGHPGDLRSIAIRKIEKSDTVCIVTIKTMRNPRKGIVFVHRKTYRLDIWNDFQALAKRYFREDDQDSGIKTYFPEGVYQRYELKHGGNYHVLSERQTGSNGMLLRDYLEYLLSPIFDEECPLTTETRGRRFTRR